MAEFSEVSRGYIRMCESFFETCEGCPISACSGNDIYVCRNRVLKNPEKYEDTIMNWAAEHPEPVYPTWVDWFRQIGVVPPEQKCFHAWLLEPMSADTAQKLGLQPKEVDRGT